jgi:hypothetical protein
MKTDIPYEQPIMCKAASLLRWKALVLRSWKEKLYSLLTVESSKKAKVVLVHAIKAYGGEGVKRHTFLNLV